MGRTKLDIIDMLGTMPRDRVKTLLRCKDSLASEVARGIKPIRSTAMLYRVMNYAIDQYGESAARQMLASAMKRWYQSAPPEAA